MTLQVVHQDLVKLSAEAIISLFEIDASSPEIGAGVMYFCNTNETNGSNISWRGQVYSAFPVEIGEVEYQGKGASNRPKIAFGNVNGFFSALNIGYQDLLGAKVTRRRVMAKYLDGHASANTGAGLPDDVFWINQKVNENRMSVTYELAGIYDFDNLKLPMLKVNSNSCVVRYRGPECSWTTPTLNSLSASQAVTDGNYYLANNRTYKCIVSGTVSAGAPGSLTNTTIGEQFSDGTAEFQYLPIMTNSLGAPLTTLRDRGLYSAMASDYLIGDFVYRLFGGIRIYSVCIQSFGVGVISNPAFWTTDVCTKRLVSGCQCRFGKNTVVLPFLAFPGTSRLPYA